MNLNETPDLHSLNKSASQNASAKITRSKRSSKTYSKIFPVPRQDSDAGFHKSNSSSVVRKPLKSKTRTEREPRFSTEQLSDKRFSDSKGCWNNFEAYEKTFNPSKILSKKDSFFSSAVSPQQEDNNSARMNDSDRSARRLISKKMTPLSGFGVSSIGKMESLGSLPSPGLQDMRYNDTPIANRNRKRVFHFGSNRDGFKAMNSNELPPISPPANQFSFKVIHPKKVEQDNVEESEPKKVEDNEKEPEALDKDDAAVQAISASSSEMSEEGDDDEEESDESFVDSLVEDNPYEDGKFNFKKSLTLRTLHTHIRESHKYAGIRFILFPDDSLKQAWDIVILVALLYTALIMPIRLAFIDNPVGWVVVDWIIDGVFMADILMNFFTAYFDAEDSLVTSKKKIFRNYILGWFIIDFTCIFPFQTIFDSESSNIKMFKLARLPRLYRLLKIVKLVRMVKVIKDEKQFQSYMKDTVKLGPAYERLLLSVTGMVIFCHVLGCIWFILISLVDSNESWVSVYNLEHLSGFDQYIACLYYVIQTVVTVGYGDMTPIIYEERLIACFFMVIGVLFYSVFIGFLSSLVSDIETLSQKFSYKLSILNKIKSEYGLSISFTKQLICAIKYENKQKLDYKHFISELPAHLGIELSFRMYYDLVCAIPFFQNRSKSFIAAIGPLLRPMKIMKDEFIFMEGDPADEVFFIKSGKIAFVLPKFHNFKFLKVREGYFFGEVDLLFYGEIRKYCAMAVKDSEFYVLNKKDFKKIFLMEYRDIGSELYVNAQPRKIRTRRVYKEALEICRLFQASPATQGRRMSKQRLSLFRSEMQNAEEADSDDSAGKETKIPLLPDIVEEEDDFDHKNLSPKTPLASLKKAITLRKGENPFGRKSSFGEAIAAHKEKFADSQRLNQLSEKMETLEDHLTKVVKLTTALSKKLAQKEKMLKESNLSLKPSSPMAKSPETIRTIKIIKTQPKNLSTLSPHHRFDFDEDFIDKILPSTIASGSDHTVVQSVIISEENPNTRRLLNSKDDIKPADM